MLVVKVRLGHIINTGVVRLCHTMLIGKVRLRHIINY